MVPESRIGQDLDMEAKTSREHITKGQPVVGIPSVHLIGPEF